ncbi:hypothetical protein GGR53DRAFT_515303 [Hypoxylon sp. FL1150]|nr:hypothetical protein GGR53DRAFT_515303 [Hypoxylon sp. FL1150]
MQTGSGLFVTCLLVPLYLRIRTSYLENQNNVKCVSMCSTLCGASRYRLIMYPTYQSPPAHRLAFQDVCCGDFAVSSIVVTRSAGETSNTMRRRTYREPRPVRPGGKMLLEICCGMTWLSKMRRGVHSAPDMEF